VSGDFYWAQKINNEFIIVCADCTGHGVPGAFMSLMGIGYLKEIVNQKLVTRPDIILNELRERIIEGFSMNNNKDGMDASLVKLSGLQLQVAAANNSIWIIRNDVNIVVKPDKFPIGSYLGETKPFTLNTMQLEVNDLVILFTDGYADQFGGPNNKKHNYKAIEKLILSNHKLPLDKMKQLLHENLNMWQGSNEQVDDILVIGFRA
jgi:serine phosphatase RsbU (regulator of sigma subunit)